jgi:hypothetical protein
MNNCYDKPVSLLLKQGDTWKRRFIWKQKDVPLDLNFTEAIFQVKNPYTKELVASASSSEGNLIITPEVGVIDVFLNWRDTLDMEPGLYASEIELRFLDGTVESSPVIYIRVIEDVAGFDRAPEPRAENMGRNISHGITKKARYG